MSSQEATDRGKAHGHMRDRGMTLDKLIGELPEVYQPIYGRPDLVSSRHEDSARVDRLLEITDALAAYFGRPLRVLDLGSAQGYIDFLLAERRHRVIGLDYLAQNIAVADAIADLHPHLDVKFIEGDVANVAELVDLHGFDLVLGYSVLHHVAYRDGHSTAVDLATRLANTIPHGVFEMALASEPVYWAEALPKDPRITLQAYPFIRVVGRTATHLSDVRRPTLYCSRDLALVANTMHNIRSWFEEPHLAAQGVALGAKRYFFLDDGVAMITARYNDAVLDRVINERRAESRRCAHVLEVLADTEVDAPRLIEYAEGVDESVLVQGLKPGDRLDEVAEFLDERDRVDVTGQVLEALATLEEQGLYHEDLRLWNVLWDSSLGQAHLIDYGSVVDTPSDTAWPGDGYFSVLTFLTALWGASSDQTGLRLPRSSRIGKAVLPPRVIALVGYLLAHPRDERVIADVYDRWRDLTDTGSSSWPRVPLAWNWLAAVEEQRDEALANSDEISSSLQQLQREHARLREDLADQVKVLTSQCSDLSAQTDAAIAERDELETRLDAVTSEYQRAEIRVNEVARQLAQRVEAYEEAEGALLDEIRQLTADLNLVKGSKSWRLTQPLRRARSIFKRDR